MDIQNTGTLTSEKLKKKSCSLKLTRPPDNRVIVDTRPHGFVVVSDDLTTANMDPCTAHVHINKIHAARYHKQLTFESLLSTLTENYSTG